MKSSFFILLAVITFSSIVKAESKISEQCLEQFVGQYKCTNSRLSNWVTNVAILKNQNSYSISSQLIGSLSRSAPTDRLIDLMGSNDYQRSLTALKETFPSRDSKDFSSTTKLERMVVCDSNKLSITNKSKEFSHPSRNTPFGQTTRINAITEVTKLGDKLEVTVSQVKTSKVVGINAGGQENRELYSCDKIN